MFMSDTHSYFALHISHVIQCYFILTYSQSIFIFVSVAVVERRVTNLVLFFPPQPNKAKALCCGFVKLNYQLVLLLPFPGRVYKYLWGTIVPSQSDL